ncbi:MAG: AAA domain-containing protein, partial [Nitrospiraceae bacterium]
SRRLADMSVKSESYTLGPAERLLLWLDPDAAADEAARAAASPAVFGTVWSDDLGDRRSKLAAQAVALVRGNKRLLVVSPDHRSADDTLGVLARALRAAGLQFKSLTSRYEMAIQPEAAGMALPEFGFEAQMHHFYARSRADKATLRRKYERFRELTPLLAYKAEKQRDLDEVKLLEWRLITQCTEFQDKIKEIDTTLAEYEAIPIWKRLAMQTMGKNIGSLAEYRTIYEQSIEKLKGELDIAKQRISELIPEAAIPKDLRPEYQELKEEVTHLGGTKKIRELLAAEEGTNRQAFIQNKRIVVTTASRVASDALFTRVRFDVLIADEAPFIPAPFLLAASGLVREKIILTGDTRDLPTAQEWASPWRQRTTHDSRADDVLTSDPAIKDNASH